MRRIQDQRGKPSAKKPLTHSTRFYLTIDARQIDHRVEEARLPSAGPKRDAYVAQIGADGFRLLDAIDAPGAPPEAAALPAVALLRRVWDRHFERMGEGGGSDLVA